MSECQVDFKPVSPEAATAAVEQLVRQPAGQIGAAPLEE
jgi:hypothetical protein